MTVIFVHTSMWRLPVQTIVILIIMIMNIIYNYCDQRRSNELFLGSIGGINKHCQLNAVM